MAKRGAGDQLTKDDHDDRGGDEEDPGTREAPLAPVAGRQIRGMPKRKGLTPAAEPAAPTPPAAAESAPKPSPFASFAFGAPSSTPSTTSAPSSFSFGQPAASAPPAAPKPSAFSGFSFKPAAPPAATAAETAPAANKRSSDEPEAPVAKKPFSGFSFTSPASAAAPSTSTSASAGSGGSFGATPAPAAPAPIASRPIAGTFSFGGTSTAAPSASASTGAFSFGQTATSASKTTPDAPKDSSEPAPSASAPKPATPAPTPTSSTAPPEGQVKYYTSLRGLNTSVLSFLTTTLENDAFVNLGDVLPGLAEQYKRLLEQEASKAGWNPAAPAASASPSAPKPAEEPKRPSVAPPAVPSGGFTFGGQTSSASTPAPSGAKGFTPTLPAGGASSSSPFNFSFGAKPAEQSKQAETPKKPSAEVTKLVQDVISGKDKDEEKKDEAPAAKTSGFVFGAPSTSAPTSTPVSSEKKAGSGLFSFAPSGPFKPATPDSKSFSPSANLEAVSSSTPPAKLGKFGPGGSAPQLPFGGAATTPSTPGGGKPTGFAFGAPPSGEGGFSLGRGAPFLSQSTASLGATQPTSSPTPSFSFGSPAASQSQDKAAPAFTFGAPSTPSSGAPSSSSFTFGAPSSAPSFNFGQSAGSSTFGFGAVSKPATSTPAAPITFSPGFGKTKASSGTDSSGPTESSGTRADGGEAGEAEEAEAAVETSEPSVNLAETGGAGEEGEETLFTNRAKLFKLVDGKFEVVGLGAIKLKKRTEGNKRRLLMRTDGNGVVILNMSVTASLAPTADKNSVKFVGSDLEGKPMVYTLKVKTADMASAFVTAVNKEVEAIKGGQ